MPGHKITAISQRYADALILPHDIATRAEVWRGDDLKATLNIDASGSVVNIDRAQVIRSTCSISLTDPSAGTSRALVKGTAQDLLSPYGNELVLYSGITYEDGTQELIQLGVFGIEDVIITDTGGDLVIAVTGNDRSRVIQRAGFTDVYTVLPSTNVRDVISDLVAASWTGDDQLNFNFAHTDAVTPTEPLVYQPGDDPLQKINDLAAGIGYAFYFNRTGDPTFARIPDPQKAPTAWSYNEGLGNIATEVVRTVSRAGAPNYIIRDGMGNGIAVPVRGVALDDDPGSPTYWQGPYQRALNYNASALYATQAQAQAAADAALSLALGSIETLQILGAPKPDHDVDDVVKVTRVRAGVAGRYVIDSLIFGFGNTGVLSMTGRRVARLDDDD